MACPGEFNDCFTAGDDLYFPLTFQDSAGVPHDLTGATAAMDLRDLVTSASVAQVMTGGVTVAALGQMAFTLTDIETAALVPRAEDKKLFAYSVKLTYADFTEQTIITGNLTIQQVATE